MELINLILESIQKDPSSSRTLSYFPLLIDEIDKLFEKIKLSKTLEDSSIYFNKLQTIQDILAALLFKYEVKMPEMLVKFVGDCDRLDDDWLRNYLFNAIKNNQYLLYQKRDISAAQKHQLISQAFGKDNKIKLYWLINEYLSNNIDSKTFCNEFVEYYNELDTSLLTNTEYKIFAKLNPVAGSLSKYREDFNVNKYYEQEDLKKMLLDASILLKK